MSNENVTILPAPSFNLRDINFGIVLLAAYILFDFGAFQGVFEIVNKLRLPFIVALLSVLYVLYLIANNRMNFSGLTTKTFILLCVFLIIYAQISTIDPLNKKAILTLFLQYLANYLIFISCVKNRFQFILLIDIWLFGILHSSYHAIYQGGKLWDSIWLKDENHISLVCAYAIPFAFFLFMSYKSKLKKIFYAICITSYVIAVVISLSRGGLVAMVSVSFLCWLFIRHKLHALMIIVVAIIMVFQFAPPKFFEEAETIKMGTEEGTANTRIYSWGIAVTMFKDFPIIGVGPANYAEYFQSYDYEERYGADKGKYAFAKRVAHSTPFQWLAELGIIGSMILLILQLAMYRNWKIIYVYKNKINDLQMKKNDFTVFEMITHACAIAQVGFWVAAIFLSLMPYPFYWVLVPFSETWKNIFLDYINNKTEESNF